MTGRQWTLSAYLLFATFGLSNLLRVAIAVYFSGVPWMLGSLPMEMSALLVLALRVVIGLTCLGVIATLRIRPRANLLGRWLTYAFLLGVVGMSALALASTEFGTLSLVPMVGILAIHAYAAYAFHRATAE